MNTTLFSMNKSVSFFFFLLTLSLVLVLVLLTNVNAQDVEQRFVVGELNHPRVKNFYKPLIERAYSDIGIDVTFERVGGERGLRLLNQGMTDADIIRYEVASQPNSNIVIVPPALSRGASFLLCIRGVQCDKNIIEDPEKAIAVTTRFFFNMQISPDKLNANIFEFDDFNHVINLLLNGRFDYAILPSDYSEKAIFEQSGIEYVPLVEHKLVHVIHKKHAYLIDRLSAAIAKQLEQGESGSNQHK